MPKRRIADVARACAALISKRLHCSAQISTGEVNQAPNQEKSPHTLIGAWGRNLQIRSKRSAFMTLVHAATKSLTNFSLPSSCA